MWSISWTSMEQTCETITPALGGDCKFSPKQNLELSKAVEKTRWEQN
jgi:hypothetical protein